MSNEDWDQFIIIDEQPYYKNSNKNKNLYCFKTPFVEMKNTNKVPGDFSINDVINNSKKNNSYIELLLNTSGNFVKKIYIFILLSWY